MCALPCSDNEIIAESSGIVFGFKIVLQQLRDCVHSLTKYFFALGQSGKASCNHVVQYFAQIMIHLAINLASQIVVYQYPQLLYNCPCNNLFNYELSQQFRSQIEGVQGQQCINTLEEVLSLYYDISVNKTSALARPVLFAQYIL